MSGKHNFIFILSKIMCTFWEASGGFSLDHDNDIQYEYSAAIKQHQLLITEIVMPCLGITEFPLSGIWMEIDS